MCGIAGLIHRGKSSDVGAELTSMLQALKHRGPDSTGFALYGNPTENEHVIRLKVAEQEDLSATVKDRTQQTVTATASWPLFAGGKNAFNYRKHQELKNQKELLLEEEKKTPENNGKK